VRLVYVTASLPYGRGESFVIPEVEELLRRGHEVELVPTWPRGPVIHDDARPLLARTRTARLLSGEIVLAAARELGRSPRRALGALARLLRSRSPLMVAKNLAVYPKSLWLARRLREGGVEHVHAHWAATPSSLALVAAEIAGVSWSLTTHRWDIGEDNLLELKVRRACFVRAINELGAELIRARAPGAEPIVLHVGVPLPPGLAPPSESGIMRLVTPALLLEVKGHEYLLRAVRLLLDRGVDVRLDLAGDGPLRARVEQRRRELGLDEHVAFLGTLSHLELLRRFEAGEWDAVVLSSIVTASGEHEGIPVSLLEGMARGLVAVGTTTGGMPELLEGGAGLLVPPADPAGLADELERLWREPSLRAELARAGRRRVEDEFDLERVVDELERRFEGCARR